MPRPCKCRLIGAEPGVTAFKPLGVPARVLKSVELRLDELEAIRLADCDGLYQDVAAERMGVSRATFGRLIATARHKVGDALLNGKTLVFRGGNVVMSEKRTFECADCGSRFQVAYGTGRPAECPSCHSQNIHRAAEERGGGGGGRCRRRGRGRQGGAESGGRQGRRGTGDSPAEVVSESNPKEQDT